MSAQKEKDLYADTVHPRWSSYLPAQDSPGGAQPSGSLPGRLGVRPSPYTPQASPPTRSPAAEGHLSLRSRPRSRAAPVTQAAKARPPDPGAAPPRATRLQAHLRAGDLRRFAGGLASSPRPAPAGASSQSAGAALGAPRGNTLCAPHLFTLSLLGNKQFPHASIPSYLR